MRNVVYTITFVTGATYVGATTNFVKRKQQHRATGRSRRPTSRRLSAEFEKDPAPAFEVVACALRMEDLVHLERLVVSELQPTLNKVTPCQVHTGGRSLAHKLCEKYGTSYPTYYARRKLGWSLYEALGLRTRQQERKVSKVKKVVLTVNGKTRTLDGWAKELGVSTGTLHGRRSAGWSDEQVVGLAPPPAKLKRQKRTDDERMAREEQKQALLATGEPRWKLGLPFELDGETATLSEHCRRKGVAYHLVRGRLRNGWPMGAAFDPPRRLTAGPRFVKGVEVRHQTC